MNHRKCGFHQTETKAFILLLTVFYSGVFIASGSLSKLLRVISDWLACILSFFKINHKLRIPIQFEKLWNHIRKMSENQKSDFNFHVCHSHSRAAHKIKVRDKNVHLFNNPKSVFLEWTRSKIGNNPVMRAKTRT